MAGRPAKSDLDWAKFLTTLAETGNLKLACRAADCSRSVAKRHYEGDPAFAAAWNEAMEEAADGLEAEAFRRAVNGVEEPVLSMGKVVIDPATDKVMTVRKYSDKLLELLLRACNPKFKTVAVIPQAALDAARAGGLDAIAQDPDPERLNVGKSAAAAASGSAKAH